MADVSDQRRFVAETDVDWHQFMIADFPVSIETAPVPANGLFSVLPGRLTVYVGASSGTVTVAVEPRTAPPGTVELDGWDEVCEADLYAPAGEVAVRPLVTYSPGISELPVLSTRGAGLYRVRVHARGRDLQTDIVAFEPIEDYLIQVWPTANGSVDQILKATDALGERLRQNSETANSPSAPRPQPPQSKPGGTEGFNTTVLHRAEQNPPLP
jgi:hypothetical protein